MAGGAESPAGQLEPVATTTTHCRGLLLVAIRFIVDRADCCISELANYPADDALANRTATAVAAVAVKVSHSAAVELKAKVGCGSS